MSDVSLGQIRDVYANADVLYTKEQVDAAYDRLASAITAKLGDSNPLVICVMVGGMIPAGQLLPRLDFPLQIDYLHATRYRGKMQGGELHWIVRPALPMKDRVVLLIDDIFDEGITLTAIRQACEEAGAREIYTAVLLNKIHERKTDLKVDFAGLEIVDRYVFGCGMDYKGYLRNAPGIYAVKE